MRFTIVQRNAISKNIFNKNRLIHTSQYVRANDQNISLETPLNPQMQKLYDRHKSAILYSSFVENNKLNLGYVKNKIVTRILKNREYQLAEDNVKVKPFSIALKYWDESKNDFDENLIAASNPKSSELKTELVNEIQSQKKMELIKSTELMKRLKQNQDFVNKDESKPFVNDWMNDYDIFDDSECSTHSKFGTPDPLIPVSKIPCYGCGALLQCADAGLPGYLPSELFKGKRNDVLKVTEDKNYKHDS